MDSSDSASMTMETEEDFSETSSVAKKYQQSLFCNRYLPYHEALKEEAEVLLEEIKRNFSWTVQKHELWPGALFWTNRLRR